MARGTRLEAVGTDCDRDRDTDTPPKVPLAAYRRNLSVCLFRRDNDGDALHPPWMFGTNNAKIGKSC